MEKVVYLLGAGFSAPLGLPVMSNFLMKSKDMYFENQKEFSHFEHVFQTIRAMSVSKNYYEMDLFNIEEILSVLEMNDLLDRGKSKQSFRQYIIDVIKHFTPTIPEGHAFLTGNWYDNLFLNQEASSDTNNLNQVYGYFVGSLLRSQFTLQSQEIWWNRYPDPTTSYSVITLNYDLVLENYAEFIRESFMGTERIASLNKGFSHSIEDTEAEFIETPHLAKLHGSVDTETIVPPTWNKGLHPDIRSTWRLAFKLLKEANHIRVIGYSLPLADSYVKYLLKAAVIETPHLKSFDVLCLDSTGSVKQQYADFVAFPKFRYVSGSVLDYLSLIYRATTERNEFRSSFIRLNKLEHAHQKFFEKST